MSYISATTYYNLPQLSTNLSQTCHRMPQYNTYLPLLTTIYYNLPQIATNLLQITTNLPQNATMLHISASTVYLPQICQKNAKMKHISATTNYLLQSVKTRHKSATKCHNMLYSSLGSVKDGKVVLLGLQPRRLKEKLKFSTIYQNCQYPAGYLKWPNYSENASKKVQKEGGAGH